MKGIERYFVLALVMNALLDQLTLVELTADVKKLTEDKYQITCKLGRPVRGVNNTVWDCVGDGR